MYSSEDVEKNIFSAKQGAFFMEYLFSHFVQRITFLTTFFIMVQGYPQKERRLPLYIIA